MPSRIPIRRAASRSARTVALALLLVLVDARSVGAAGPVAPSALRGALPPVAARAFEPAPYSAPSAPREQADDAIPEYALKAAVLYNFARYTEWPSSAFLDEDDEKEPFVFAILGSDPFGKFIDDLLAGKELAGRKVVLRRYASLDKLERCHVLFVSRSVEKQLKDVVKAVKPWSTFTVAEFGDFARDGGVARIFIQSLQVRFEINTDAAERARLKISSQLLKLSVVLKDD